MKAINFYLAVLSIAGVSVTALEPALAKISTNERTSNAALPICSQLKREYARIPRATSPRDFWRFMPLITKIPVAWRPITSPSDLSEISSYLVADASKRARTREDSEKVSAWEKELPRDISSGRLRFIESETHVAGSSDTYHVIKEVFVGRDARGQSTDDSWSYIFYRDKLNPDNSESRLIANDFAAFLYSDGILFVNPNETDIEGPVQSPAGDAVVRPQIGMQIYCELAR